MDLWSDEEQKITTMLEARSANSPSDGTTTGNPRKRIKLNVDQKNTEIIDTSDYFNGDEHDEA